MNDAPSIDLFSPDFLTNPWPMIDSALTQAPLSFDPRLNAWLVSSYDHVKALEREPSLSSQREAYVSALLPESLRARIRPLVDWYARWMVMRDGDAHHRLRSLAAHAFQPRALRALERRILEIVDHLLDRALAKGHIEIMSEFASPLPRAVICEMIGVPETDMGLLASWTADLTALLAANLTTELAIDHAVVTRAAVHDYFAELIEARRHAPREGELLTSLVHAKDADGSLTQEEIIDLIAFIMTGAYDTTGQLIGNAVHMLLTHPDQLAAVRADPTLVANAVEETLRCEPSITLNTRAVARPFDYAGAHFEPGQMVYFLVIAANRDAAHFPDPHRFDVRRPNSAEHIAFGFGPHTCIGAPLARMEARIAIGRLLERAPDLRLPEQTIHRVPNMVVRRLQGLQVSLSV